MLAMSAIGHRRSDSRWVGASARRRESRGAASLTRANASSPLFAQRRRSHIFTARLTFPRHALTDGIDIDYCALSPARRI